jgi:DNA polymerase-3 subunit epsilon
MTAEMAAVDYAPPARADGALFAFFDLQTTGLRPSTDRIIAISARRVGGGGQVVDEFDALVGLDQPLPPFVPAMTGITEDMLRGQNPIRIVFSQFLNFIEDLPLVSYNVSFDMSFLKSEAERLRMRLRNTPVCALQVARRRLPNLPNHKLETVAAHLGLPANPGERSTECDIGLEAFVRLMQRPEAG